MEKEYLLTRRDFLRQSAVAVAAGCGAAALYGCGGKGEPCSDLTGLSEEDKQTRITYLYRSETLIPAKRCTNCHFWVAPAAGATCGTCTLVKGPISPDGYCNSWAEPKPEGEEGEAAATEPASG